MDMQNELFGPVEIEGYGVLLVPGATAEERAAYAAGLTVREGIFIPGVPCESVVTFNEIEEGTPYIAIGIPDSYGCYTVEDLMMVPDDSRQLIANLPELVKFARYYRQYELEERLIKLELGLDYFNELKSIVLSKRPEEIRAALDAFDVIHKTLYFGCRPSELDIVKAEQALAVIKGIFPTLKSVKKAGNSYVATSIPYVDIVQKTLNGEYHCLRMFDENTKELANVINSVYSAKELQKTNLILTPTRKQELLEIGPAITLQPGGTNVGIYQQQGPWKSEIKTARYIHPVYRRVYEICGGVINTDSLLMLAEELDIPVPMCLKEAPGCKPQDYTKESLCQYIKNYIDRYTS